MARLPIILSQGDGADDGDAGLAVATKPKTPTTAYV